MAALQNTLISLQSKFPSSTRSPRIVSTFRPCKFSFSTVSLKLGRSRRPLRRMTVRMSATSAATYAEALADVTKSNHTLDATIVDLEKIEKLFSDTDIVKFFDNPMIDTDKKFQVLEEISKSSSLLPTTTNFLKVLIDANRVELLRDIVLQFEEAYYKLTDTELAVVSSVVKMEQHHLAQIAKQVQKLTAAKNVRIKTVIDPSLVAGFTVRYGTAGSKLIDMSVKKQLDEIAAQMEFPSVKFGI